MNLRCRELVIGSGPAGAITSALLAESGRDVIVVEEGGEAGTVAPFSVEELSQNYRYRGLNPALGRPKTAYVEGCCVGGGSEINSALYHRAPDQVLERWTREHGVRECTPEDLLPHFEAIEQSLSVCKSPGPPPAPARKLISGAEAMGWGCVEVSRWVRYREGKQHPDGSPVSDRMSMSKTWLPRAAAAGARLLSRRRVARLERRAGGWVATAGGDKIVADHIFLCCGAIQTPLLLRRSGVRRRVGDSLAMHPMLKVVALFGDEVNYEGLGVPFHQVREFGPRLTLGESVSSPSYLAMALLDHPEAQRRVLERWRSAAVYYASVTGPASGRVRRVPFTDDPLVRYQISPAEQRDLADGVRKLAQLLFRAGAQELYTPLTPGVALRSEADVAKIPEMVTRRTVLASIHLFGSCPMGGAVDSWGRVVDAPGLSVHDGSVFCDAPGVNPQGMVMALARRNSLRYLGE